MRGNRKVRLLIGVGIIIFAVIKYCSSAETNPYTGEKQHIALNEAQEIAMGLQAAPQMAQQHGGLYPNENYQTFVDQVGNRLVNNSIAKQTGYKYDFHLLADKNTINAFALPGGQIFITYALFSKLENEDQLAGVLGHEIGHVVGRHSAERIAQGAAAIGQMLNMSYGRDDELQSDDLGVKFMIKSNYNPEEMIGVMEILKAAAGPNRTPERMSTHPDPENRVEKIKEAIKKYSRQ